MKSNRADGERPNVGGPRSASLPVGTSLDGGRYELLEVIDTGSTCTVYRARQLRLDRLVAVKVFSDAFTGRKGASDWIGAEAKAIAALNHPNLVQILDRGEHDGSPYLVLELLEGQSLLDRLLRCGRLPVGEVLAIAADLLSALAAAHDQGIVHRDIKPQNIMLVQVRGEAGELGLHGKICDFGIAASAHAGPGSVNDGTICGTPEYMSPEQTSGLGVDARSDLYAVGITLYHMLTGQVPFYSDNPMETITMQVACELPAPRLLEPRLSVELEDIILKATAKAPDQRFDSARTMAAALRRVARGQVGTAVSVAPPPIAPRPAAVHSLALARALALRERQLRLQLTDAPTLRTRQPRPRLWLAAAACLLLGFGALHLLTTSHDGRDGASRAFDFDRAPRQLVEGQFMGAMRQVDAHPLGPPPVGQARYAQSRGSAPAFGTQRASGSRHLDLQLDPGSCERPPCDQHGAYKGANR